MLNQIQISIVGNMSHEFRSKMKSKWPKADFTGRVESVQPYLDRAVIGVIPEEAGGGFKLKSLEYIFNRIPLFALEKSICNLDLKHGYSAMLYPDMASLCQGIVDNIYDIELLNKLQKNAFKASQRFAGTNLLRKALIQGVKGL